MTRVGYAKSPTAAGAFVLTATPPAVSVVIASPSGRPATVNATTRGLLPITPSEIVCCFVRPPELIRLSRE